MIWLNVKDHPYPDGEFIGGWIDKDGELAAMEWFTYLGFDNFMNVNSSNINEFDSSSDILIRQPPNVWVNLPLTAKKFSEQLPKEPAPLDAEYYAKMTDTEFRDKLIKLDDFFDDITDEEFIQQCKDAGIFEQ